MTFDTDKMRIGLNEFYQAKIDKFGANTIESTGYRKVHAEHLYKQAAMLINIPKARVLDLGCGMGNLYDYIRKSNLKLQSYTGWDASDIMIEQAKKHSLYPSQFELKNIIDIKPKDYVNQFDTVVALGIFVWNAIPINNGTETLKLPDNWIPDSLMKIIAMNPRQIIVNFRTTTDEGHPPYFETMNPGQMFNFIRANFSPYAIINHEYSKYEFLLTAWRLPDASDNNNC